MKKTRALSFLLALALLVGVTVPGVFALPARADDAESSDSGLQISKTAVYNENTKDYTITLEAYATGSKIITSVSKDIPTDIILVLDRSGSMGRAMAVTYETLGPTTNDDLKDDYEDDLFVRLSDGSYAEVKVEKGDNREYTYSWTDENGNPVSFISVGKNTNPLLANNEYTFYTTAASNETRMEALKKAALGFVDSVAAKAKGADPDDPRDDVDHRLAVVSYASDATNHTSTLLNMTDPNNATTAKNAINSLTANGGTLIDSGISMANGIFSANPILEDDTSGRQRVLIVFTDGAPGLNGNWNSDCQKTANNAIDYAHTAKDTYKATVYTIGIFPGANASSPGSLPTYTTDRPNTAEQVDNSNRFMHLLSSNYLDATSMTSTGGVNPHLSGDSYYLSASNSESLNAIFQKISQNIEDIGSSTTLGTSTVVKDIIAPQFTLPANATSDNITLETYKYGRDASGNVTWTNNNDTMGATASIDPVTNQVNVTGFDFSTNWCGDEKVGDEITGYHGSKLVISFNVTPKEGFLGGNDVYTNGEASGIYANGTESTPLDTFERPTVNVPIVTPVFTVNDKTIYEGNSTAASGLYELTDYTTEENAWKAAYVQISTSNTAEGDTVSPTVCTDYTVTVTYAPTNDGTKSAAAGGGTANSMDGVPANARATVHVLHPNVAVTVNDVQKYYGEDYTLGDGANGQITLNWEDSNPDHTVIPEVSGTAPYTKNDLSLAYSTTQFSGQSGTVPKQDFDVIVKVQKGGVDYSGAAITTTCGIAGSSCAEKDTDGKYTVHVKTCQLTISKRGGDSTEPYVFDVYKDGTKYSEVTVKGDSRETIFELPVGAYTIQEDTGWSWRYNSSVGNGVTLSATNNSETITCTNSINKLYWLNGFSAVVKNIFNNAG